MPMAVIMPIKSKRMMKFFKLIYKIITAIVPVDRQMSVYISYPDVSDNSYHLFVNHLQSYPLIKKYWLVDDVRESKAKIQRNFNNLIDVVVCKRKSVAGVYIFIRSYYVFHTHGTFGFVTPVKNKVVVNLTHGMPIKKFGLLDKNFIFNISESNYIITTSELFAYILASSFMTSFNNMLITGIPRNDALHKADIQEVINIKNKLGIKVHSQIVFWLPTYKVSCVSEIRQDSVYNSFLEDECVDVSYLNELALANNIHIIVKLHPMDHLNNLSLQDLTNIHFINALKWKQLNIDLYASLRCSDGLLSDVSSVVIDYMLTGKPIGAFNVHNTYTRGTNYEFNFNEYQNWYNINAKDDLVCFINAVKLKKKLIKPMKSFHKYADYNSINRINSLIFKDVVSQSEIEC